MREAAVLLLLGWVAPAWVAAVPAAAANAVLPPMLLFCRPDT